MSDPAGHRPVQVHAFPNRELGIVWDDEHESYFPGHDLRCSCGCAKCVDETTGRKVLEDDRVPKDVHVTEVHPVGNYGISVRWSDGHETGIYTFARLRQLCPCCH
jgi:ATP-binding protein involved in chromosome partitioning